MPHRETGVRPSARAEEHRTPSGGGRTPSGRRRSPPLLGTAAVEQARAEGEQPVELDSRQVHDSDGPVRVLAVEDREVPVLSLIIEGDPPLTADDDGKVRERVEVVPWSHGQSVRPRARCRHLSMGRRERVTWFEPWEGRCGLPAMTDLPRRNRQQAGEARPEALRDSP